MAEETGAPYPRVHVVINPASGKDEPILNTLNDVFHAHGVDWDVSITKKYGDAKAQAKAAIEAGYDLVAGYGGDGTNVASTSAALAQVVTSAVPVATATGVASSVNPAVAGANVAATATIGGGVGDAGGLMPTGELEPEMVAELEKLYGFDRPVHERYFKMLWDFARLDFGNSYYQDRPVIEMIGERLPVSISLGLWTTLLTYLVSIPLGIRKAVRSGTPTLPATLLSAGLLAMLYI